MNWQIQSYTTGTGGYIVSQRSPNDWLVLDPTATVYDGFTDENSAMAFAESLVANMALPAPPTNGNGGNGGPPQVNPNPATVSL